MRNWFDKEIRPESWFDPDTLITSTWFDYELDISGPAGVTETLDNTASSSQTLSVEATSESDSNSANSSQTMAQAIYNGTNDNGGTGSQSFSEATAESVSNSASSTQSLSTERTAESPQNSAASTQSLLESEVNTLSNSASSSQSILSSDSDSGGSSGSGSQTFGEATAESPQNVGGPLDYGEGPYGGGNYEQGEPHTMSEALSETISNSATATIAIDESITVDNPTDDLTNTGAATHRINEADASSEGGSGTGSSTLAEATAETVSNSATATHTLTTERTSDTDSNSGSGSQTLAEATAESVTNSASSTQVINTTEVDSGSSTGTGSQTLAEKTAETVSNTGVGSQTMAEAIRESVTNSATSTPIIVDLSAETEGNTGTGTQAISEATAEGASNTGTNTPDMDEDSPELPLQNVGFSSQSLAESIAEAFSHSQTSTQAFSEADADSPQNSGTGSHTLSDYELDNITNTGTGTPDHAEALAETDLVSQMAIHSIDDATTTRVVPFSDISTGTWTVVPLYEKVDELYAVGGYPTESIRSANNPVNDTAIMGLTPVSDPSVDTNHYINVEFWRDGSDELDFIIRLKEGATIIAERTFENVLETEDAPRQERIALTELEASAIVDYSNLNIELVANQV